MSHLNLVGKQFGRLTVVEGLQTRRTSGGNPIARWRCACSCGKERVVSTGSLRQGKVKSCGCLRTELTQQRGFENKTHGGFSKSVSEKDRIKWQALCNIYERAKRRGYESDIELGDLPKLGDVCPVLGIKFKTGTLKNKDSAPSIDRKNTNLPYLKKYKDNLVFISHRANRLKSDGTIEEFQRIIDYVGRS
jgi:hypothetical protein